MNNSDCSEDCFEDFYFFYDGEDEGEFASFNNELAVISSQNKDKIPNQDPGGFFHTKPDGGPQISESVIYENTPSLFVPPSSCSPLSTSNPTKIKKPYDKASNFGNNDNSSQIPQFINLSRFYGQSCHKRKRVELDENGVNFRTAFYNVCGKSVFPKEYVQQLHDAVCSSIGLPPITRTERRSIRTYFRNYARYKNKIIKAVKDYLNGRQDLVNKICTPCKLKNSTKKSC